MKKLLCVLGFICASAHAADWAQVGSDDNSSLSIDTHSIQEINGYRQAWSMWSFKTARDNPGDMGLPNFKSYQDLTQYNCVDGTSRLTREILFQDAGGVGEKRDHTSALSNMQFSKPAKDTIAEILVNFVCNYKLAGS